MNQATLHDLLSRYVANQCTDEERQLVEYWYDLLGESPGTSLNEEQWLAMESRIWKHLEPSADTSESAAAVRPLWRRIALAVSGVAALAAIAFGVNWYREQQPGASTADALVQGGELSRWKEHVNKSSKEEIIRLPDSSTVTLEPGSRLAVSHAFNQNDREVRLMGEAAFDVRRNPQIPFVVVAGEMVTKVLGTRFRIRAVQKGQPVEVDVQSGKVTVYSRQTPEGKAEVPVNNGLILTPNQKATYFPESAQFVARLTENPEPITTAPQENRSVPSFIFKETPLSDILHQLEQVYGTEIELEQETLANCPFTGNLTRQSFFTQLELLCGAINGTYEIRGTKILITGKGCL